MKYTLQPLFFIALFLLCSCTVFEARQTVSTPVDNSHPLVMPVSKNWQIIEAAPKLSDERGRLPFQKEQSLQPDVAQPAASGEIQVIKAPL